MGSPPVDVDVLDRRRRPLRRRRRRPPAGPLPGQDLGDAGGARRRSAAPGTCSAIPGVRSDSDMFTLGYSFRPWTTTTRDRRRRHDPRLRPPTPRASAASTAPCGSGTGWSRPSGPARRRAGRSRPTTRTTGTVELTCRVPVLLLRLLPLRAGLRSRRCPERSGSPGELVHPQHWPADLQWAGQAGGRRRQRRHRGDAGARAGRRRRARDDAAALPELRALACRRATRSPRGCSAGWLPLRLAAALVRARNIAARHRRCTSSAAARPALVRRKLLDARAGPSCPPATTSTRTSRPAYDPWDQRLCVVPDGDLFRAVREGRASVVTDRIDDAHRARRARSPPAPSCPRTSS